MITESKNPATGIIRFEINTTRADVCRKNVEDSGFVTTKDSDGDTINYDIYFNDQPMKAMKTETRFVLWGMDRREMMRFCKCIKGNERRGTVWEYDDYMRSDYQNQK